MRLVSVNVGSERTISDGKRSMQSGIVKTPTEGEVFLGEEGIATDVVLDTEFHGGPDQAVYAYSADDYDWWSAERGIQCRPGLFGENLTIRGMPSDMNIGDRLLIGEVVLEATAPRIPCRTFATHMRDKSFGVTFRRAERPGIYFRVLNVGAVMAGDTVTYVPSADSEVSVLDLFHYHYAPRPDAGVLRRLLTAPVSSRTREQIQNKIKHLETIDPI